MPDNDDPSSDIFIKTLRRDRWVGAVVRGGQPRIPALLTLPTASADYEGQLVYQPGTTGQVFVCMQVASTWTWVAL